VADCSGDYRIVGDEKAITAPPSLADGWRYADVAVAQNTAYRHLLDEMQGGRPRLDLAVAVEAVRATGLPHPEMIEIGCGSGYYAEVFAHARLEVQYFGVDISAAMIGLAQAHYPQQSFAVADACALPFADRRFDVVMNGVSLMHILDWRQALAEARRVTRRFVLLHTLVLLPTRPTIVLVKSAYGRRVLEVIINEQALLDALERNGLRVIGSWTSIPYDLGRIVGEPTKTRTILAEICP